MRVVDKTAITEEEAPDRHGLPTLEELIEKARVHWANTGEACYNVFLPEDFLFLWDEAIKAKLRPESVRVAWKKDDGFTTPLPAIIMHDWRLVIVSCGEHCH